MGAMGAMVAMVAMVAIGRGLASWRQSDFPKDTLVPDLPLGGIDESMPDAFVAGANCG